MGIRLEFILIIAIVFAVIVTMRVKLSNGIQKANPSTKELEFSNTIFIEVDREKMQARSFADYGVRDAGILSLNNLRYHTHNIELLLANKGTYRANILYLEGNVSVQEKDGFYYTTQYAKYNQKTEILNLTSTFRAKMDKNIITGKTLRYNALKKEVNATSADAIVYTTKK